MMLTKIDTGEQHDVEVPTTLPVYWTEVDGDLVELHGHEVSQGEDEWLGAVQQWALSQGYEAPQELPKEYAKDWDESEHPRRPKGSETGGEFAPKGSDALPEAKEVHRNIRAGERTIRSSKKENLIAYTPDGKVVLKKAGGANSVGIDFDEGAAIPKNAIVTHNHPGGESFSHDDLIFAAFHNVASLRVVTKGNTYSLTRPSGGWPKAWKSEGADKMLLKQMEKAALKFRAHYQAEINARRMSMTEARHQILHDVLSAVAKKAGVKYARA